MLETTISSIRMLVTADPESDKETVERIVAACRAPFKRRELIGVKEVGAILAKAYGVEKPISKMTIWKMAQKGLIHPVRLNERRVRYDKEEIEHYANYGIN